jgi:formyl-CoA transferase
MRLSKTPVEVRMPPPLLGEHTDEVLRSDLNLTIQEITHLRSKGVID